MSGIHVQILILSRVILYDFTKMSLSVVSVLISYFYYKTSCIVVFIPTVFTCFFFISCVLHSAKSMVSIPIPSPLDEEGKL